MRMPELVATVRDAVLADDGPITDAAVATAVQSTGQVLGAAGTLDVVERVRAELNGLGPLQPLIKDPAVTDVLVNAPDSVWVDSGAGPRRVPVAFSDENQVRQLACRLIAAGGRRLDDGCPCVDVRLDGGLRVHAVLPPISTAGTLLSIRIPRFRVFTLEELVSVGTIRPETAAVLEQVLSRRLNFLVSGATGSGKTTLLSTLLGLARPDERLVLIEDAAELTPDHPHVVSLQSRHGNLEGTGVIELSELVRQALRMRPDRLIVGECRGAEVRELLAAMNTGHGGAGGTIHANAAATVPARLAALGALAGMPSQAIALQAGSALDVVIHLERTVSGRRVTELGLVECSGETLTVSRAASQTASGLVPAEGWDRLQERLHERPGGGAA